MSGDVIEDLLRDLVRLARAQVQDARAQARMARVQVYPVAKQLLREEFFEGESAKLDRIRVYASLDGSPQRVAAEKAGVAQPTVSRWSTEWKRKGLVDEDGIAVFNPYDFFPELEQ